MPNDTDKNIIDSAEYKKVTEEMYKQNLELARLYKQVDNLNKQRESLVHLVTHKVKSSFTRSIEDWEADKEYCGYSGITTNSEIPSPQSFSKATLNEGSP